eukprot:4611709-Amphidinium_carterae.1
MLSVELVVDVVKSAGVECGCSVGVALGVDGSDHIGIKGEEHVVVKASAAKMGFHGGRVIGLAWYKLLACKLKQACCL